jgi:Holliday junction resolvasome RuvABC DNA-binding subunit
MKKFIILSLFLIFIGQLPVKAQFSESDERKKMWRKSGKRHKAREAYNPYLNKKKKDKPSQQLSKQNAREQKRQLKAAKKQKRKSMKKLGYKEPKVKKA